MSYIRNGYKMIYLPNHHRAEKGSGMVYEHIYLAEKYIGRPLEEQEVVHHEDRDRSNNSEENLFVFKTQEDHNRYHATGKMIKLDNGSYISPIVIKTCKNCGKEFQPEKYVQEYCNKSCASTNKRRVVERPSKEELELLIKTKSFSEIGRDFGVSDNAVRKWCKSYDLPHRKKDLK